MGSDIQRKVILTLIEPTPTSRSAHPEVAHTLPDDIGFHPALEGEYKRSVLEEYSHYRRALEWILRMYGDIHHGNNRFEIK